MKRLILMRHAKSSWDDPAWSDAERPLNERGRRAATRMGRWLRHKGYLPDIAMVSTSVRTRETWTGVSEQIGPRPVEFLEQLYHADTTTILETLRAAKGGCVLILGHQPGIGAFAAKVLARRPSDEAFARYPTTATSIIDFEDGDWPDLACGTGELVDFATPRGLN